MKTLNVITQRYLWLALMFTIFASAKSRQKGDVLFYHILNDDDIQMTITNLWVSRPYVGIATNTGYSEIIKW